MTGGDRRPAGASGSVPNWDRDGVTARCEERNSRVSDGISGDKVTRTRGRAAAGVAQRGTRTEDSRAGLQARDPGEAPKRPRGAVGWAVASSPRASEAEPSSEVTDRHPDDRSARAALSGGLDESPIAG